MGGLFGDIWDGLTTSLSVTAEIRTRRGGGTVAPRQGLIAYRYILFHKSMSFLGYFETHVYSIPLIQLVYICKCEP